MREMVLRAAAYLIVFFVVTLFFQIIEWEEEPENPPPPLAVAQPEPISGKGTALPHLGLDANGAVA